MWTLSWGQREGRTLLFNVLPKRLCVCVCVCMCILRGDETTKAGRGVVRWRRAQHNARNQGLGAYGHHEKLCVHVHAPMKCSPLNDQPGLFLSLSDGDSPRVLETFFQKVKLNIVCQWCMAR